MSPINKENFDNLTTAKRQMMAFAKAAFFVDVTGDISPSGLRMTFPAKTTADKFADAVNRMAEYDTCRGVPLGQIAQSEPRFGEQGPYVYVFGNTAKIAEIAGRLSLRERAPA